MIDPYIYSGTDILINKFNIRDKVDIEAREADYVSARMRAITIEPVDGCFDFEHLCAVHGYIFQDIYDWAGQIRAVPMEKYEPDFCVLGTQNFWGYVVYGFSNLNLFIFECNLPNNATYIFNGNWKTASKLTKTEILGGHLQEARLFHTEKWYENVRVTITSHTKVVA